MGRGRDQVKMAAVNPIAHLNARLNSAGNIVRKVPAKLARIGDIGLDNEMSRAEIRDPAARDRGLIS